MAIYTGKDGKTYRLVDKSAWNDDYKANNMFRGGSTEHLNDLIKYYLDTGKIPTRAEFNASVDYNVKASNWSNYQDDLLTFIKKNKIDESEYLAAVNNYDTINNSNSDSTAEQEEEAEEAEEAKEAKEAAYNAYYRDMYSLDEGTFGKQMLDNYTTAEQNAAISNMQLAEAQYQQAAMQQAEVVKSITDQVKAERMARLRAGMSESQIANQDMQMMLNNMNTLNQQTATMNQNRLVAQQQYNLAQDTAYQQYINSATGLGSVNAAMAASDAGDAYMQALKYQRQNGGTLSNAYNKVTGGGK